MSHLSDATQMFYKASSFNQDLCSWSELLAQNAKVSMMFSASGCFDTRDPVLVEEQGLGPFCSRCEL
jgi:hypothetical protein